MATKVEKNYDAPPKQANFQVVHHTNNSLQPIMFIVICTGQWDTPIEIYKAKQLYIQFRGFSSKIIVYGNPPFELSLGFVTILLLLQLFHMAWIIATHNKKPMEYYGIIECVPVAPCHVERELKHIVSFQKKIACCTSCAKRQELPPTFPASP